MARMWGQKLIQWRQNVLPFFSFSFVLDYLFRVFLQCMAPCDLVDVTWIKEKKSYSGGGQRSECLWRVDFGFTKIEWRLEWGKIRKPRLIDERALCLPLKISHFECKVFYLPRCLSCFVFIIYVFLTLLFLFLFIGLQCLLSWPFLIWVHDVWQMWAHLLRILTFFKN